MKYSIITTVIALALSSQLVSAGSITDTYTVGDTLTAAIMDNIKTAVNDNSFSLDASDGLPADVVITDTGGNITMTRRLEVKSDIYTTSGIKLGGTVGSRSGLLELRNTIPWSNVIVASNQNNSTLFVLNNSGNVTVTGSVTAASHITVSDFRYKKNIASLEKPLEKVLKLRGVNFEWDTDKYEQFKNLPGKQVGFIAQEVNKVIPESVFKSDNGYLAVSYNALIPILVEAVKEQQQLILKLTKEIESFNKINKELHALKKQIGIIQAKNDIRSPINKQQISMINK